EYLATEKLDPAFLGRFAFIIPAPETTDMNEDDIISVCKSESFCDAPALRKFEKRSETRGKKAPDSENRGEKAPDEELKKFVTDIVPRKYMKLERRASGIISSALSRFCKIMLEKGKIKLDGRRMAMIRRSLIAYLAVKLAKGEIRELDGAGACSSCCEAIPYLLPGLDGKKVEWFGDIFKEAFIEKGKCFEFTPPDDFYGNIKEICNPAVQDDARRKLLGDILANKEIAPLAASALLPFMLKNNSCFSAGEIEDVSKKVESLVKFTGLYGLKNIKSAAALNYYEMDSYSEYFDEIIDKLCDDHAACMRAFDIGIAAYFAPEPYCAFFAPKQYMLFLKECIKTLRPLYDSLPASRVAERSPSKGIIAGGKEACYE
ncbi:MAG: hypothetical protein COS41_03635, partial [Elusimicrobia bacterium CG03_land_8_20_14_0_80_50_18]